MTTKKRVTKAQREAAQKAALLQRVTDVYCGALGGAWGADDFAAAPELASIIPALRELFGDQCEYDYIWQPHCIRYFNDPVSATDHLFGVGIRA